MKLTAGIMLGITLTTIARASWRIILGWTLSRGD